MSSIISVLVAVLLETCEQRPHLHQFGILVLDQRRIGAILFNQFLHHNSHSTELRDRSLHLQ